MNGLFLIPAAVTAALLFFAGCSFSSDPTDPFTSYPTYTFGFVNVSNEGLTDVKLYMFHKGAEEEVGSAGSLRICKPGEGGKTAFTALAPQHLPARVTLRWQTTDGRGHSQEISLMDVVADRDKFKGTVWFRYENTGRWRTIPLTEEQTNWRVTHDKSYVPDDRAE